jgi:hypothetical protein
MCDFSAEAAISREAKVGDELVTGRISPHTIGLVSPSEGDLAVCLCDGTRIRMQTSAHYREYTGLTQEVATGMFIKDPDMPEGSTFHRDGFVFDELPGTHWLLHNCNLGMKVFVDFVPAVALEQPTIRDAAPARTPELVAA